MRSIKVVASAFLLTSCASMQPHSGFEIPAPNPEPRDFFPEHYPNGALNRNSR